MEEKSYKKGVRPAYYYNKAAGLHIAHSRVTLKVEGDAYFNVLVPVAWCLNIEGKTWEGRTMAELWQTLEQVATSLQLKATGKGATRLCVFVDKLGIAFDYFRGGRDVVDVVAKSVTEPLKVLDSSGIEFRSLDAYRGQEEVPNFKELRLDNVAPETPLTNAEWHIINTNAAAIMEYERQHIAIYGGAANLALTIVRIKQALKWELYNKQNRENTEALFDKLTLTPEEYRHCLKALWGGFAFTNPNKEQQLIRDVVAYDINSDYLAQQFCQLMPMDLRQHYRTTPPDSIVESIENLRTRAGVPILSILRIEATKIEANATNLAFLIDDINNPKRFTLKGAQAHQGHILKAEALDGWMTVLDYTLLKLIYKTEESTFTIKEALVFNADLIPNAFINETLRRYKEKTKLKGDKMANLAAYADHKSNINAGFGIHAQSILKEGVKYYKGEWYRHTKGDTDIKREMSEKKRGRFQWLPWGVFTSAWARYTLLSTIYNIMTRGGADWLTADTDSCYITGNKDKATAVIKAVNAIIRRAMINATDKRNKAGGNYSVSDWEVMDSKGKLHSLGAFELDGTYQRAKSLHAKCHLFQDYKGDYKLTLAGTPNKEAKEYILEANNPWAAFQPGLVIPEDRTGKHLDARVIAKEPQPLLYKDRDNKERVIMISTAYIRTDVAFSFSELPDF